MLKMIFYYLFGKKLVDIPLKRRLLLYYLCDYNKNGIKTNRYF